MRPGLELYRPQRPPPGSILSSGRGVETAGLEVGGEPVTLAIVALVSAFPGLLEAIRRGARKRRDRRAAAASSSSSPTGESTMTPEVLESLETGSDVVYDMETGAVHHRRPPPPPLRPGWRPGPGPGPRRRRFVRPRALPLPPRPHRRGQRRSRSEGRPIPGPLLAILQKLMGIPGYRAQLLRLFYSYDQGGHQVGVRVGFEDGGDMIDTGHDLEDFIEITEDGGDGAFTSYNPLTFGADDMNGNLYNLLSQVETGAADVAQEAAAAESGAGNGAALTGKLAALEGMVTALQGAGYVTDAAMQGAIQAASARAQAAMARARDLATIGKGYTGVNEGAVRYNAAGEPQNATLNPRPFFAPAAATPRNVFTVPAGGTTAAITLSTQVVSYQVAQVIGFKGRQFSTQANNSEVFVQDLLTPGSGPLFSSPGPIQLSTYDTETEDLIPLRFKPQLSNIDQATVVIFAVGNNGDIVTGHCAVMTKVLNDTQFGPRHNPSRV